MGESMKEIGKIIICMEKEYILGKMEENTKVFLLYFWMS
jgi:hypothetical protein